MNPISKKTVLVTGATGFIGSKLIHFLVSRGYQVRSLARRLTANIILDDNVDIYEGDILDRQVLKRASQGINIIFHLAAKLHRNNLNTVQQDDYKNINVEGTRRLVEAAKYAKVDRLIFFSTINVYKSSKPGMILNEKSPVHPVSLYSQTKAHGEKIVLGEIPAVVLRLSAVYGPQMKGNYSYLIKALQKGCFIKVGHGLNRRTLVYIYDVCQAAAIAAEHPDALGRTYNITDGRIYTMKEIVAAMCIALGKKPPRFSLSANKARAALGVIEDFFQLLSYPSPVGRHTVDKLIEDLAVSGERIQQELGFVPQYNLSEGLKDYLSSR